MEDIILDIDWFVKKPHKTEYRGQKTEDRGLNSTLGLFFRNLKVREFPQSLFE
jgi:hypothetical protein